MNPERLLRLFDRVAEAPDAVARLRRLVLDLAVRGKLVEQHPDDEPAEILLDRLHCHRDKVTQDLNTRKLTNIANIKHQPFQLPENWKWVSLSSVGAIIGGGTPRTDDLSNFTDGRDGVPWLTPADLGQHKGKTIRHGSRFLSRRGLQDSSAKLLPAGTVLFTSRAPIGYCAIAENALSTNQGFKSIVPAL